MCVQTCFLIWFFRVFCVCFYVRSCLHVCIVFFCVYVYLILDDSRRLLRERDSLPARFLGAQSVAVYWRIPFFSAFETMYFPFMCVCVHIHTKMSLFAHMNYHVFMCTCLLVHFSGVFALVHSIYL